jgi:hypothetical protein
MPTARQELDFENASTITKQTGKGRVLEISLRPSLELWAALSGTTSGYAEGGGIPVTHKSNAVSAVIAHLKELEAQDPEF